MNNCAFVTNHAVVFSFCYAFFSLRADIEYKSVEPARMTTCRNILGQRMKGIRIVPDKGTHFLLGNSGFRRFKGLDHSVDSIPLLLVSAALFDTHQSIDQVIYTVKSEQRYPPSVRRRK